MERAVEFLAVINFLVMGVSHIVHRRAWAESFIWLRGRGHAGVFVHGFLSLSFGSLVVAFHNVWTGLSVVLNRLRVADDIQVLALLRDAGHRLAKSLASVHSTEFEERMRGFMGSTEKANQRQCLSLKCGEWREWRGSNPT